MSMPADLILLEGAHETRDEGMCLMEMVAWRAGEPHTDAPACACPVISDVATILNDAAPEAATRTRVLMPYVPRLMASKTSPAVEAARLWALIDLTIRELLPEAFEHIDEATTAADLRGLPPIHDRPTAEAAGAAAGRAVVAAERAVAGRAAMQRAAGRAAMQAAVVAAETAQRAELDPDMPRDLGRAASWAAQAAVDVLATRDVSSRPEAEAEAWERTTVGILDRLLAITAGATPCG